MINLFVFRHAETFDNNQEIFSGWRDSKLTLRGLEQANEIAEQLEKPSMVAHFRTISANSIGVLKAHE